MTLGLRGHNQFGREAPDACEGNQRLAAKLNPFEVALVHEFVGARVSDREQPFGLVHADKNRVRFHDNSSVHVRTANHLYAQTLASNAERMWENWPLHPIFKRASSNHRGHNRTENKVAAAA